MANISMIQKVISKQFELIVIKYIEHTFTKEYIDSLLLQVIDITVIIIIF